MSRNEETKSSPQESDLVGGALKMLSQYEANTEGDEYSDKNPSDKYLSALNMTENDSKSLKDLSTAMSGAGLEASHKARKSVLHLTPLAFHHLTETARKHHNEGKSHKGASHDISKSKSQHHLASMLARDYELEGKTGGSFWHTLGDIAKSVIPLVPLMI